MVEKGFSLQTCMWHTTNLNIGKFVKGLKYELNNIDMSYIEWQVYVLKRSEKNSICVVKL